MELFPPPLSPTSASFSPLEIEKSIPLRALFSPYLSVTSSKDNVFTVLMGAFSFEIMLGS